MQPSALRDLTALFMGIFGVVQCDEYSLIAAQVFEAVLPRARIPPSAIAGMPHSAKVMASA